MFVKQYDFFQSDLFSNINTWKRNPNKSAHDLVTNRDFDEISDSLYKKYGMSTWTFSCQLSQSYA